MRWAHMVFWLVVVLAFAMGGRAIAQEAAVSEQESVARDRALMMTFEKQQDDVSGP